MAKAKKRPAKKTRAAARVKKKATKRPKVAARAVKPARKPTAMKAARPKAPAAPPAVNPVRQLAQRIVNLTLSHDDDGCLALYAANVESMEPGQPVFVGVDAIKQKFAGWRAMAPQSTWRARTVSVDGNTIVIEWEGDVTFATGKQSRMNEVAVHEVENGKIARERFYYDRAAVQP